MKFLQKLGKALMLPVAVLPICGILMGIGYWLCPATMQGGEIQGAANLIGLFLVKAGGALIDNMAILFAIGVGVGMSEKNDGTGGITALAVVVRCIGISWRGNCWSGCSWRRYLRIHEPSVDPNRFASCSEQCILVRYDWTWFPVRLERAHSLSGLIRSQ